MAAYGESEAKKDWLAREIRRSSYLEGDFTLSSGKRSHYYFDKYLFETKPQILKPLAQLLAEHLPPQTERIAGLELGAVALATAVSLETGIPFIVLRREEKGHGGEKRIEGEFKPGERVVLVEDIMTTGHQVLTAARGLEAAGLKVLLILGVVDREEGARENILEGGFPMQALFTRSTLEAYR